MTTDLSLAVQESVFAMVDADAPLEALIGDRVYDAFAPDKPDFPYIVMPPFDSVLNRFKDGMGQNHDVIFVAWSRPESGGVTEVRNIIGALYDIFEPNTDQNGNRSGLSVTGGTVSHAQIVDTRLVPQNDRRTYQGIVSLNVRTRSNA